MVQLTSSNKVDSRHPELVFDALLQVRDLLVLHVRIGDQDLGELATPPTVPDPVAIQGPVGLDRLGPLDVHGDRRLFLDQPKTEKRVCDKFFFIKVIFQSNQP